jgi:hypothetical protein
MYRLWYLALILVGYSYADTGVSYPPLNLNQKFTVMKLRTHCNSCHGVGDLRFFYSDDDEQAWHYLQTQTAPKSKKLWAEAIKEVLSWPSETPPSFDQPMSSGKDWMPKGYKRLQLAEDMVNGQTARAFILSTLTN